MVVPSAMLGLVGETWIDDSVAKVMVSRVLPDFVPEVAVIVAEPEAIELARPLKPAVLLTAATAVSDEFQVTDPVRS